MNTSPARIQPQLRPLWQTLALLLVLLISSTAYVGCSLFGSNEDAADDCRSTLSPFDCEEANGLYQGGVCLCPTG